MAEKIADQIAQSGGIGIADQMLKDQKRNSDLALPASSLNTSESTAQQTSKLDEIFQLLHKIELDALVHDKNEPSNKLVVDTGELK